MTTSALFDQLSDRDDYHNRDLDTELSLPVRTLANQMEKKIAKEVLTNVKLKAQKHLRREF